MSIIDDLKSAIDNYETDNCKTEIVNFKMGTGESVLNEKEVFMFQIKVTNQSHIDMKSVKVQALGTVYADIAPLPGLPHQFGSSVVSSAFDLDALQNHTTGFFMGKAKKVTTGVKDIVTARIFSWDASLHHILIDHSGAGVAEGKLSKEIFKD